MEIFAYSKISAFFILGKLIPKKALVLSFSATKINIIYQIHVSVLFLINFRVLKPSFLEQQKSY